MYSPRKYLKPMIQVRRMCRYGKVDQKNHYDTLGISAKATQADIKSAYYKLSMLYHPDKSKDNEDLSRKFRTITEAYEVLGNVKTRKLYDRGLLMETPTLSHYQEPPLKKFYQSRENKPPAAYGRSTVYDFDEWSKSHYESTFQAGMRHRAKTEAKKIKENEILQAEKNERAAFAIGALMLIIAYLLFDRDYDNPSTQKYTAVGDVIVSTKR